MSQIEGIDRLFNRIRKLSADSKHVERPLEAAGIYMEGSVERNFKASGRPQKWEKLAPSTLKKRRKGDGKIQILSDSGVMKSSLGSKVVAEGVQIGVHGVQAPRMHYGYPGGTGRGRSKTPARPFLMFQREDLDAIGKIFTRHIGK
jgi:phage gpG-like protein